jgi:hypothetical protein
MKYLCLIYDEEKKLEKMSKEEGDKFMGEYFAFTDGIKQSGQHVASEALQPISTATTIRMRNGKLSTTDGPFAETKEQLLGFYIVDCKSLEEAIEVARSLPSVRTIFEIRPVKLFFPGGEMTPILPMNQAS